MQHRQLTTFLFAALAIAALAVAQNGSARYQLTFQSTWSAATHPIQFPGNPHYSPLVGGTHTSSAVFWAPGGLATAGIEQMAETGGTSGLVGEVNQQINQGNADQILNTGGPGMLGSSPGQLSITFTADANFSQLTLVTMLAPSPDWFVGLHGYELIQNGDWVESAVIPLHVYDAGTDSGSTYTSANANMVPQDPIALVTTNSGPFVGASTQVGTFTLQRLSSSAVYGCGNPTGSMAVIGAAELGQSMQLSLADPTGQLPTPAISGLAISAAAAPGFPCGTMLPGFGLANGTSGEVLLGSVAALTLGSTYSGSPVTFSLTLPSTPGLVGQQFYLQGLLASARIGLTEGVAVRVGN